MLINISVNEHTFEFSKIMDNVLYSENEVESDEKYLGAYQYSGKKVKSIQNNTKNDHITRYFKKAKKMNGRLVFRNEVTEDKFINTIYKYRNNTENKYCFYKVNYDKKYNALISFVKYQKTK